MKKDDEEDKTQYGESPHSGRLICEMDVAERPREKAMRYGLDSLSDAELMAIIFATGFKGRSVIDVCQDILSDNNWHLSNVARLKINELKTKYKGIGTVKAITFLAALELGKRAGEDAQAQILQKPITSADLAYQLMRSKFQWLTHEEFWVVYLNRAGRVIREEKISQGGTAATVVDAKIILKSAIECLASSMLLFHNHPSGTLRPSVEDDRLTNRIVEGAKIFDIRVNDHLIITDTGYYSYAEKGKL